MIRQNLILCFLFVVVLSSCKQKNTSEEVKTETEEELVLRALEIHKNVLTL